MGVNAEAHFRFAQALEAIGNDLPRAMEEYQHAADLDHNPFRAISDLNRILRRLANPAGAGSHSCV